MVSPDRRVSRVHALLYAEDQVWKVRDVGSSNGTFLKEEKIAKADLPAACRLRFHREGPELELSVHKVEQTAMSRDALTRDDATAAGGGRSGD